MYGTTNTKTVLCIFTFVEKEISTINVVILIHTITADNGKEFAKHQEIAKELDISFYFCKPYHSWERGANENTNGLIRQYIPKGTDFSEITDEFVSWIENKLNNRPRKRLGYLTPNEKFNSILTN